MKRQEPAPNQNKRILKILQEKGSITIQTEDLAIQALFSTPVLEVANYIQQLQKYSLRGALSSLNLKIDDYDRHYSIIKGRIEDTYNFFAYKSVGMIQELLLSLKLLKIEMWREQNTIANGFRIQILNKNLDPYNFNSAQFDQDLQSVCSILRSGKGRGEAASKTIQDCSQKLGQREAQKMQEMFSGKVSFPYLGQNKEGVEINTTSLYNTFQSLVKIKGEKSDETLLRRLSLVGEEIARFMQATVDHSFKTQKIAYNLIKKYSDFQGSEGNDFIKSSILPPIRLNQRKHLIGADQLYINNLNSNELRPAFTNRIMKIQFKEASKIFDAQTSRQAEIGFIEPEDGYRQWDRYGGVEVTQPKASPLEIFSEKKRNNPKQFYQPREFQKQKYREEELRLRDREKVERENERGVTKKLIRPGASSAPFVDFAVEQHPFLHFYEHNKIKQSNIWEIKYKPSEKDFTSYWNNKDPQSLMPSFRTSEERSKYENEMRREAEESFKQRNQEMLVFEARRREEEAHRLFKHRKTMEARSYERFIMMSKLDIRQPPMHRSGTISRYGLQIPTNLDEVRERELKDADKFCYMYFKERYYRQNQCVKENADNPIIFLDSAKVSMEASPKIVSQYLSSIMKRTENFKFFLVWGEDLVVYRQNSMRNARVLSFECYPFGSTLCCQKLMYELRRRSKGEMKEEIKEQYACASEVNRLFSKVEVTFRVLFNRHLEPLSLEDSVSKGRKILAEIIQELKLN